MYPESITIIAKLRSEAVILKDTHIMKGQCAFDPDNGILFFDKMGELHKTQGKEAGYTYKDVYQLGQVSIAASGPTTLIKGTLNFYVFEGLLYFMGNKNCVFIPNKHCESEFIKNIPEQSPEEVEEMKKLENGRRFLTHIDPDYKGKYNYDDYYNEE